MADGHFQWKVSAGMSDPHCVGALYSWIYSHFCLKLAGGWGSVTPHDQKYALSLMAAFPVFALLIYHYMILSHPVLKLSLTL